MAEQIGWDELGDRKGPSWYLDVLVARQKRRLYREFIREETRLLVPTLVLKTDLFEEAFGADHLLYDLLPHPYTPLGMDISFATALHAKQVGAKHQACLIAADVRRLPLRSNALDLIVSTSTLDHFGSRNEFLAALGELARVLRPGGLLVISVDNALNPLYPVLRWLSKRRATPFPLGYTTSDRGLAQSLQGFGLEVVKVQGLIHNPRIVSTALFLGLRRLLGRNADGPINFMLSAFSQLGRLPARRFTACFAVACARKPFKSP